jgi:membrane protein involved in colicin uptake
MSKTNEKTIDEAAKAKAEAELKAEEKAAKAKAEEADPTEGLVKMHKNGETLYVHPTTVASHETVGWKLV